MLCLLLLHSTQLYDAKEPFNYFLNDKEHTFVVHVGRYLHHAEAEVNRQVVEMVIGLQDELST